MAIERFEIELISAKKITSNVCHLRFKKADGSDFSFIPGQFVTFLFDHESGKPKRRSYSISSIPGETAAIELAISYVEGGIASEALFNMKPGDTFNAMGPAGRLVLKAGEKIRKLVLAGTGTGIAPYRAMLPTLQRSVGVDIDEVHILLGVQYRQDVLYGEDFRRFVLKCNNIYFNSCLSRETTPLREDEVKGYVQHQFDDLALNPEYDIVYLCGNPNMIDYAFANLTGLGFDSKAVRREKYISSN